MTGGGVDLPARACDIDGGDPRMCNVLEGNSYKSRWDVQQGNNFVHTGHNCPLKVVETVFAFTLVR